MICLQKDGSNCQCTSAKVEPEPIRREKVQVTSLNQTCSVTLCLRSVHCLPFPPPWPCQMLLWTMPTLFISGGSSNSRLLGLNVLPPHVTPLSFPMRHSSGHSFAPASLSLATLRDCFRLYRRWLTDSCL